ncbi:MAG: hypothetical protein J6W37_02800 [Bacteroidales bacterium]|nr:hypothetical protein [Bacteroidales bacterium]
MKKIFEKIENKEEWIQKNNDGSFLVWKKSLNGLIVRIVHYRHFIVEFMGPLGTITALEIPEPLLPLYINDNKVFLDKLLEYLTEQQKDVAHIVPEQFFEQIKKLALQYSTKETLDAVNDYMKENNWKFTEASPHEKRFINKEPLTILESGWTCSDFWEKLTFLKKVNDEVIMVVFPEHGFDFDTINFYLAHTDFRIAISKKSIKHLLQNANLYAMLRAFSQIAENENTDTQVFINYLTNLIKDSGNELKFRCTQKKNDTYEFKTHKKSISYCYNLKTDEIFDRYGNKKDDFILSDKEKDALIDAVHDFDAYIDNVHKNYICASYGNDTNIYYKRYEDSSIYYEYVVEYVAGPNLDTHITEITCCLGPSIVDRDTTLSETCFKNITFNTYPIYMSAKENNDRLMELMMKDLAGFLLTNEEAKELEKLSKGKYLRRLGVEHNKLYVIDEKSMNLNGSLLSNSGYRLGHWPYCARMVRSGNPMINPYTKRGHDTSPRDCKEPVISFSDFLKLFEIPEEK